MKECSSNEFIEFEKIFKDTVNKHLPIKKKTLRNNHAPFINKRGRKEIMLRSQKKNIFDKFPTAHNWNSYRIQRNKCVRIIRQAKKEYFKNLDVKKLPG